MDFFQEVSFDKAETLFNLVRGVMKKRAVTEGKVPTKRTGGKKKDKDNSQPAPPPDIGIRGDAHRSSTGSLGQARA